MLPASELSSRMKCIGAFCEVTRVSACVRRGSKPKLLLPPFNFGGRSRRTDGTLQAVNGIMLAFKLKWAKKPLFVSEDGKIEASYAHADMTGLAPDMYAALI